MRVLFFSLATGAALGAAWALLRGVCRLLGLGPLAAGFCEGLFGCLAGGFVFLCALAVDSGRLRLYQALPQALGAWAAAAALSSLSQKAGSSLRKSFCRLWAFWAGASGFVRGLFPAGRGPERSRGKKTGKKPKKAEKRA